MQQFKRLTVVHESCLLLPQQLNDPAFATSVAWLLAGASRQDYRAGLGSVV